MDFGHIAALAIVQGVTEFLPISSSAHLILAPVLFGWPDQGLTFDVAAHLGTLAAVSLLFAPDLKRMLRSLGRDGDAAARMQILHLLVGTLPVLIVGVLLVGAISTSGRAPLVIAAATIGFGILMAVVDLRAQRRSHYAAIDLRRAALIGLAQVLALIPGTSRSGITITAAQMLGVSRTDAARFSFLLSIPVILAAASYGMLEIWRGAALINWTEFALAAILSALAGFACLKLFLGFIERTGLLPYAIYRVVLGLVLWWVFAP